jgi:uncharacterized heparinase superfamily protein
MSYESAPARYLDAARHMRERQLVYRARRLVPPALLALGLDENPAAELAPHAAGLFTAAVPPWGSVPPPAQTRRFDAAGATRAWGAQGFWEDSSDGLLFLFALHGFDELARYAAGPRSAAADEFWREVLTDWLERHRRPRLPAWHPYPLSGRILSWCSAAGSSLLPDGAPSSVGMQANYLTRCVEHDIGGNHVLRNAVALTVAGSALDERRLLQRGMRLLESELRTQLLADGGHEERSTAYHGAILADLDDLAALLSRTGAPPLPYLEDARRRMTYWVDSLVAPDGAVPRLNDAWDLDRSVPRSRETRVTDLADTGYVILGASTDHIVLDVGPLCPPHLPAHAHADALSFVAWFDGRPMVVDPGIGDYRGSIRDRLRSTAAHATVAVDGLDQCHFWGAFRAAGLPTVTRGAVERCGEAWLLRASHDGYRRLPDPVIHHRLFVWIPEDGLVVADHLEARATHHVRTSLPLADGVADPALTAPVALSAIGVGPEPRVVNGEVSAFLGAVSESAVLTRQFEVGPRAGFGWSLLRNGARAELDGRSLVVRPSNGEEFHVRLDDRGGS